METCEDVGKVAEEGKNKVLLLFSGIQHTQVLTNKVALFSGIQHTQVLTNKVALFSGIQHIQVLTNKVALFRGIQHTQALINENSARALPHACVSATGRS